ncbi:MAG: thiamine phosphate synthase [Methylotenera sp.]
MKKHPQFSINGLYAVTPDELDTALLCQKVESALQGGASLLQYRNKAADATLRHWQASALQALCRSFAVPLIINDDLDLCVEIGADGVHLGDTDGDVAAARSKLGADKIIGASCYNKLDLAIKAEAAGASYVAFGACFPSQTKPNAAKADLSLFQIKLNIPKVAIGGITLENAPQVITAGADAIAVVGALFGATDIAKTSQQLSHLFTNN